MTAYTSETRTTVQVAELVEALANNIQLYTDVAQRTRIYRLYAFCRRVESERQSFHSALAWLVTGDEGVELRETFVQRARRVLAHFRIGRASRLRPLAAELRQSDEALREAAEQLLSDPELDGAIWMVLGKLVSAIRATEADLDNLTNRRDPQAVTRPSLRAAA